MNPANPVNPQRARIRSDAAALAIAGVLFLVYESVAPRADQTTLEGAQSWASARWSLAHIIAIVGLILIPLAWRSLRELLRGTNLEHIAYSAMTFGLLGAGLTISYYGAEVYGLKAIGERAVSDGDASLTEVADAFRMDSTAITVFAIGLALIALAAILAAIAIWRSGTMPRWSAAPMAAAMVLYLPHFYFPLSLRIAWGALVTVSALWIALELWRAAGRTAESAAQDA